MTKPIQHKFLYKDISENQLSKAWFPSVDIETVGDRLDPEEAYIGCVTLKHSSTYYTLQNVDANNSVNLHQALSRGGYFHNYSFDAEILYRRANILPKPLGDTKILAKILDLPKTNLVSLIDTYIEDIDKVIPDKDIATSNWSLPFERWSLRMKEYVRVDVKYLEGLHVKLYQKLNSKQKHFYKSCLDIMPNLIKMKCQGVTDFGQLNFLIYYNSGVHVNNLTINSN